MTEGASPNRLPAILAGGWFAAVAGIFLVRYDGWVIPIQFGHVLLAAVPQLRFGPHFVVFARERVLDLLWLALLLATAWPVGKLIIRRPGWLESLVALGLGLTVIAAVTLAIAAVSTRVVGGVFLLLALWAVPAVRADRPRWPRLGRGDAVWMALLTAAALLQLPGAWVPPFEYDELEYHLGAPMDYLRAGRIAFLPYNFYSNLPQLTEMLYLLALVTRSEIAAKLVHGLFGLLTAGVVAVVGSRLWSRQVGWLAAALFYTMPFVQDLSQTARVDLATAFFASLAAGSWLLGMPWHWSALAAGGAVATKWTAIPVVLLPMLVLILAQTRTLWPAVRFGLVATVPVVPWLVKNALLTGDPIYPLWRDSPHWTAAQAALFAEKHYPTFGWNQLWERPWQYSFAEPGAVPLLLATAPLIVLGWRRAGRARTAAWLCGAAYAGWFLLTFRPWRFFLPMAPVAAWVGAVAVQQHGRWLKIGLAGLWAVALCSMGLNAVVDAGDPTTLPPRLSFVQHALGQTSREEFVARLGRGVLEPVLWMNEHLPPDAKVLYVGEARVYYARHPVLWSTAFDRHPLQQAGLAELGVTHVYINFSELQRLSSGYGYLRDIDWGALRRDLQTRAREIYRSDRAVVYAL